MKLTLITIAVPTAADDDSISQKVFTETTQQLPGNLLIVVLLGHGLRTFGLYERRLFLLALLVRDPDQPQPFAACILRTRVGEFYIALITDRL